MSLADSTKTLLLLEGDPDLRNGFAAQENPHLKLIDPDGDPLAQILAAGADGLVLDGDSGLEILRAVRRQASLAELPVIVVSGDASPQNRALAFTAGADEFAPKPSALEDIETLFQGLNRLELNFWGVRGTLPIPGPTTLKYGGNTSCVSLGIGRDRQFVFDAGTGLRMFSNRVMETSAGRFDGRIFISHPHWDHFNSLPFFQPLYLKGNRVVLHGPAQGERSLRDLIDDQMDGIFFPITVEEFQAEVAYRNVAAGVHRFDGVRVAAHRLAHPGHCLAYRIDHRGRSFAYVTDNELGSRSLDDPAVRDLLAFLKDVDVLLHDCTYFDDEYPKRVNWGHSSVGQATVLAHAAGVRCFYLFHHDPDHSDADIERKLAIAEQRLTALNSKTRCHIAAEGMSVRIDRL